ncbi:ABC transporter ATP-binding protein [Streptomyces sp. F001]|uniref:ABC transporter ATP-binding protein n=1 Tax=Streptomyces sp. F001 TaxID=1510026 RepID=UPI001F0DDC00|nr:ABC transporter ATP-binding protein [Streptomyces sp. F001]
MEISGSETFVHVVVGESPFVVQIEGIHDVASTWSNCGSVPTGCSPSTSRERSCGHLHTISLQWKGVDMAQLDIVDVGHAYAPGVEEERWALKPLNLTFESGTTYALVGPSGCGKTTLLNILSGLVRPSQGRVLFDGVDVTALPTKARNIAQVFQFPVIYKSMTVYENLAFPLQCRRWDRARIDAKVRQVAEALDLHGRLRQPARGLTADDKQLISLGRGLVRDDVAAVLMDEPLTVIDPQLKHLLRRKIRAITEQFRPTVIYVTHDQYEAMSFAQEVLVMKDGRAVQQGTRSSSSRRPRPPTSATSSAHRR